MKKRFKVVFVLMSIFSMLFAAACGNKNVDGAKIIENHLKEKYGEEFVVDAIGGGYGTIPKNTLKAEAYAKDKPYKLFKVEISKDLETVWDSYMNIVMAEKLDGIVTELAQPLFSEDIWVTTEFDSGGFAMPDPGLTNRDLAIDKYVYFAALIKIFVKNNDKPEIEQEAKQIDALLDKLLLQGIKRAKLAVFYLQSNEFKQIESIYYNTENIYEYCRNNQNCLGYSTSKIEQYKKNQTTIEIIDNFYVK